MTQPNENATNASFEFDALREAHQYRRGLMREFRPFLGERVIEVGAGIGQFTELIAQQAGVKNVLAIEPDSAFCRQFRSRLPDISIIESTIQSAQPSPEWDNIVSVNVLEHIERDLDELREYRRVLGGRQGRLCLFVPARPEIYAPIDRDFGHFRRYLRAELKQKLEASGFRILRLHYFNLIGYAAWWWTFCALKRRKFDLPAVRLFDRGIFPISCWLEQTLCRPPIGQSLIAIAQAGNS